MAQYVSAFVIPVPKKNKKAYLACAKKTAALWKKCGASKYVEAIGDDVPKGKITSFPKSVKLKAGETVAFGYATFASKAAYNKAMNKLHNDPEMLKMWDNMPFDGMRMIWGSFKTIASK